MTSSKPVVKHTHMCAEFIPFQSWLDPIIERTGEEVDNHFIGCHDDGSVGDLSQQLCNQATVQSARAFFLDHQVQRLKEGLVLVPFLAKPCPGHFCTHTNRTHWLQFEPHTWTEYRNCHRGLLALCVCVHMCVCVCVCVCVYDCVCVCVRERERDCVCVCSFKLYMDCFTINGDSGVCSACNFHLQESLLWIVMKTKPMLFTAIRTYFAFIMNLMTKSLKLNVNMMAISQRWTPAHLGCVLGFAVFSHKQRSTVCKTYSTLMEKLSQPLKRIWWAYIQWLSVT